MNRFSVLLSGHRISSLDKMTAMFKLILTTFAFALSATAVAESLQEVLKSRVNATIGTLQTCVEKLERYPKKMKDRTASEAVESYIEAYHTAYRGSRALYWTLWDIDLEEVEKERKNWALLVVATEVFDQQCQCTRETLKWRKKEPAKILELVERHEKFAATMREYASRVKQLTSHELPEYVPGKPDLIIIAT